MTASIGIRPSRPFPGRAGSPRIERLIIARQSGPQAFLLLAKMLERTLSAHRGIPGYAEIRGRGLDPLYGDDPAIVYWSLPDGGRAALYEVEGTYVLLILGSAVAHNVAQDEASDPDENAVVALYGQVLSSLRPRRVITGPFDRLVRSYAFAQRTLRHFETSDVEFLLHDGGTLEFGTDKTEAAWESLAGDASASLRVTKRRLADGSMSLVRDNLWPLAAWQAPPGMTRDGDHSLKIAKEERDALQHVVRMAAEPGFIMADAARWLTAEQVVPRRRGKEGVRVTRGETFPTSLKASQARNEKFVEKVLRALPDLAMGKFVSYHVVPQSNESTFVGVRRELTTEGYRHVLAWSVPDVFEGLDEDVIAAAVATAARYRRSRGWSASAWMHEQKEREQARLMLQRNDNTATVREIRRWAGEDGLMAAAMGEGPEHPRSPLIREIISSIESEEIRLGRNQNGGPQTRIFANWPAWQSGGHEYKIKSDSGGYTILTRSSNPALAPVDSLGRTWNADPADGGGQAVARLRPKAFHLDLARAAARAIEEGVPMLQGQHVSSAHVTASERVRRLSQIAERQRLENDARHSGDRAEAASEAVLDHRQRRLAASRASRAVSTADDTVIVRDFGAASDAMLASLEAKAEEWFARAERDRRRLAEFDASLQRAEQSVDALDLDDLELAMEVLLGIATSEKVEPRCARMLRGFITRLEFTAIDTFRVSYSFDMKLPGPEGHDPVHVGPIHGSTAIVGRRRPGHGTTAEAYAEAFCLYGERLNHSPKSDQNCVAAPSALALRMCMKYFQVSHGLSESEARAIVASPFQEVREICYRTLRKEPLDPDALGVTAEYLDLITRTYLSGNKQARYPQGRDGVQDRQSVANLLATAGRGGLTTELIYEAVSGELPPGGRHNQMCTLRYRMNNWPGRYDPPWGGVRIARSEGPGGPLTSWRLRECPHCSTEATPSFLDILAWQPEVPGGMLCSNCLRTPHPDSITYPGAYLALRDLVPERRPSVQEATASSQGAMPTDPPRLPIGSR